MIELTKLNGVRVTINPELIELLEETPDTVITMATGRKYLVKESMREIRDKCVEYQQEILRGVQG
ncbi:MAG: flagellar protein FlbD [bacterium]|nr:flagellar protein FlbD [bacterium]